MKVFVAVLAVTASLLTPLACGAGPIPDPPSGKSKPAPTTKSTPTAIRDKSAMPTRPGEDVGRVLSIIYRSYNAEDVLIPGAAQLVISAWQVNKKPAYLTDPEVNGGEPTLSPITKWVQWGTGYRYRISIGTSSIAKVSILATYRGKFLDWFSCEAYIDTRKVMYREAIVSKQPRGDAAVICGGAT